MSSEKGSTSKAAGRVVIALALVGALRLLYFCIRLTKAGVATGGELLGAILSGFLFMPPHGAFGFFTAFTTRLVCLLVAASVFLVFRGRSAFAAALKIVIAIAIALVLPSLRMLGIGLLNPSRIADSRGLGALRIVAAEQATTLAIALAALVVLSLCRSLLGKRGPGSTESSDAGTETDGSSVAGSGFWRKKILAAKREKLESRFGAAVGKGAAAEIYSIIDKSRSAPVGAGLRSVYIQDILLNALRRGNQAAVEALVARETSYLADPDSEGETVQDLLIKEGRYDDLERLVAKSPDPEEALRRAAAAAIRMNKMEYMARLVKKDESLAVFADEEGKTILMAAAAQGDLELVRSLVEKGADVNAENAKGESALALCPGYREDYEKIVMLLLESGASALVASDRNGHTPLMEAVEYNRASLVKALLEKGAETELLDDNGRTALHVAAKESRSPEIISILLAAGADADEQDGDGYTPLMYAVAEERLESVRLLAGSGQASIDAKNYDDQTALDLATDKGRGDIVEILLENGATHEVVLAEFEHLNDAVREEVDALIRLLARSLDAKPFVAAIVNDGFAFDEENDIGAFFQSRSGVLVIKAGAGYRIVSAGYSKKGANPSDAITLVEWQGSNVGKPLHNGTTRREGKGAEEPFLLRGAADVLVFPAGMDDHYANRMRYAQEECRQGLSSYTTCYCLTRASPRASYDHLVVQTGSYPDMAATKMSSPHAKEIFSICFPNKSPDNDWSMVVGEQVFGNYAPEGYEISDFTAFDRLVGEIIDGLYKRDLVLKK